MRWKRKKTEEARKDALVDDSEVADNGAASLDEISNKLQSNLTLNDQAGEDDQYDYHKTKKPANSRKAQKAAQKKSKKAKRREKEEQAERDQRISAEKARQKERAERLGLSGDGADDDGGNNRCIPADGGGGDTKPCNTCGGAFAPGEYRLHFRSDWHRYNVKLKMKGCAPVSEKEFLLCDSDAFFD